MGDEADLLLAFYNEQTTQARHHEEQRATMTNVVLAVAGAATGLTSFKDADVLHLPLALFLVGVGCYGAIFSAKHYERNRYHSELARQYRRTLERVMPGAKIDRDEVRKEHAKKFPRLTSWRLNWFWVAIPLLAVALGILIGVRSLSG